MRRIGSILVVTLTALTLASAPATASGVGDASWTPARSETTTTEGRFLVAGDAYTYRTDAIWDKAQAKGLEDYQRSGLRYTHETNDRSGRLSATGYWATNHPDPVYDRDDDDGDGRWEEAEIIAGPMAPEPDRTYASLLQFSRWHPKRAKGTCGWAWDRRRGEVVVLSQLSRDLLGEWQAERYTLAYESAAYPRVGTRPGTPADGAKARCRDQRPGVDQEGYVITFARPLAWSEMADFVSVGSGKWTAFEAIGTHPDDDLVWTCGGPVDDAVRLSLCRAMGVRPEGVSAAVGYFDELAVESLRDDPAVADVGRLQDALTDLLAGVGGFGVEPPGLAVNDRYWDLVLTD